MLEATLKFEKAFYQLEDQERLTVKELKTGVL